MVENIPQGTPQTPQQWTPQGAQPMPQVAPKMSESEVMKRLQDAPDRPLNSVMASDKTKVKASWWWTFLYYVAILVLLGAAWWYVFSRRQTTEYTTKLTTQNQAIAAIDADIAQAEQNGEYMKYAWAKHVYNTQMKQQWWWDRLSRIITVFENLQKLGNNNVTFSDFSLDFSSLHLKGTVSSLKLIYWSGWIVDTFNGLDFIDEITITDYKKTEYGYSFSLVAQILLENVKR